MEVLSIFIPFIIIATGIFGFFDGNEYIYRIKNTKMYYLTIAFIFVFYGLLNAKKSSSWKPAKQWNVEDQWCKWVLMVEEWFNCNNYNLLYKRSIWYNRWMVNKHICTYSWYYVCTFNISIKDLISNIKAKSKVNKK